MKNFLAIYIGSVSAFEKSAWSRTTDENERRKLEQSGMEAWGNWVMTNQDSIIDHGSPLGKTKRISTQGISDIENKITAYTIVKAESHAAAAKIFENHPHFTIFPGDSVEVMECLPMPRQEG